MKKLIQNKKGQIDNPIIIFAVIIIALLLFAPIVLKIMRSIQQPMSASFGNLSNGGAIAQENFDKVINTGINFWDKVITAFFIFAVLLLFVSAFLVDAHPLFVVLYIFLNFMLILFAPNIIQAVDNIYDSSTFAQEAALLPFMDAIRLHYTAFLVGMMVITGIIIYGKIALFSGGRSNTRR